MQVQQITKLNNTYNRFSIQLPYLIRVKEIELNESESREQEDRNCKNMSLIHEQSCECMKSELDIFAVPATQTNVENGQWAEYFPVNSVSGTQPIEFNISGTGNDYLDLKNTLLYLKVRITKKNGDNLDVDQDVGPVNNWLHSLFSEVELILNDKLLSSTNKTYPYRAYIETLLSYGSAAKETQLTASMWYKDTAKHMQDRTEDNVGFTKRKEMMSESRIVDLIGRPHLDICFQDRYLINGVNVRLRFIRSPDIFALMGDADNYKVQINNAVLHVRRVKLSPTVLTAHTKALENGTAKYPIKRIETKVFTVTRGNNVVNNNNLFQGQLPNRVFIGFVNSEAYNGLITKNPFHFDHFNINSIDLTVIGQDRPSKPFKPNFQRGRYMRSYAGLFATSGKIFHDEGNQISRDDYGNGYSLFGFDLTPDLSESEYVNLIKNGNIKLEIEFSNALTATICVVALAEFDNMIEIDRNRNVISDF